MPTVYRVAAILGGQYVMLAGKHPTREKAQERANKCLHRTPIIVTDVGSTEELRNATDDPKPASAGL